jgi:hypothetical protein
MATGAAAFNLNLAASVLSPKYLSTQANPQISPLPTRGEGEG